MVERIIAFSVHQRWLVLLIVLVASALGAFSLTKVPIDAVPDITNNQVQINARAPSLSANEMEKQVTFAIENAIAGIPGLRIDTLALAQRLRSGDRHLRRKGRSLFRAPTGGRAPA